MAAKSTGGDARIRQFPLGARVRLADLTIDPYPILRRLREHEPVSWVPEVNMWFVTRRADVLSVLGDFETYTVDSPHSIIAEMFGRHMMTVDGPEQIRHKRACMPPFRPRELSTQVTPVVTAKVESLVKAFGDPAEIRLGLAKPTAIHTVCAILGIPESKTDQIRGWYDRFARALANFQGQPEIRKRGHEAASHFSTLVTELLRTFETAPGVGLLSDLARATPRFSDEEIVSNALIILFGGIETTEAAICNAVWALLRHPEQLALLRSEPSLLRNAIDETLRWEPAVQSCTRHATRPAVIGGVEIREGEVIQCMLGAANRDAAYFEAPARFDIRRPNAEDHVSFGAGRHYCLGASLALLEMETVLRVLLERFPELSFDPERLSAPRGYEFRKPPALWVQLRSG